MKLTKDFFINLKEPFFFQKKGNDSQILFCSGKIAKFNKIEQIPLKTNKTDKEIFDSVSLIPFCQAKERGFEVNDGGELITTLLIDNLKYFDAKEVVNNIENKAVDIENIVYDSTKEEYENIIKRIIEDEIGTGQGANFVIPRRFDAKISNNTHQSVLSIFRSLLINEIGAYSTFLFFDGNSYVIGASPERHISKRKNEVMMNPISGTFRKNETNIANFQNDFTNFLKDKKEVFELFMVTDEELKIMCELCDQGGAVIGPLLKEMSKLIHTEYLLVGNSDKNIHQLLRQSMFAPTVTGSPVQSAFRVIKRYESQSRGYYASVIALIGRDEEGISTLDAPITIRTLEIDNQGQITGRVGATLVRGSKPVDEVKETEVKISGVLNSIKATGKEPKTPKALINNLNSESLQILLQKRNINLSRFWIEPQNKIHCQVEELKNKNIMIIDAEDGFSTMLKRIISHMGANVTLVSFGKYNENSNTDLTIVGPGPGNPIDKNDFKMNKLKKIITNLVIKKQPFFAECLSHQILCHLLGFEPLTKVAPTLPVI
jgi:phenazine biosynthesis protein phzE